MERRQALETLRLDGSADGRTVESAYWNLVRRAQQRGQDDLAAQAEIEGLNEAYGALAPDRPPMTARARPPASASAVSGIAILDWFADWVSGEAQRTRLRWPHRNPEIVLIGGAAVVLMVLAIGAGAPLGATFAAAAIVCVGIWAPWRKVP
jgi:hypothetical protein